MVQRVHVILGAVLLALLVITVATWPRMESVPNRRAALAERGWLSADEAEAIRQEILVATRMLDLGLSSQDYPSAREAASALQQIAKTPWVFRDRHLQGAATPALQKLDLLATEAIHWDHAVSSLEARRLMTESLLRIRSVFDTTRARDMRELRNISDEMHDARKNRTLYMTSLLVFTEQLLEVQ